MQVKIVSVSLESDVAQELNEYCEWRHCSRSWFVNVAVKKFLEECQKDKDKFRAEMAAYGVKLE